MKITFLAAVAIAAGAMLHAAGAPAGCPDFEVDMPRTAGLSPREGRLVIRATDFGLKQEAFSDIDWSGRIVGIEGEFITFDRDPLPCAGKIRILGGNDIDVPEHLIEKRESKKKN